MGTNPAPGDEEELPRIPLRFTRREITILIVTTAIGALVGLVLGFSGASRFVATALVDAGPGGTTESALDASPDVANRYVQTELVYIGILEPEFNEAMLVAGFTNPATISARQDGPTSIVQIAAESNSVGAAVEQANIAADLYIKNWRSRATSDLRRLQENTSERIADVEKQLSKLGNSADDRARAAGLRSELTRLTQELADLQYREGGIRTANRQVQEATAQATVSQSSVPIYTLLGIVLGGAVGISIVIYMRVVASGRRGRA